MRRGEAIEGDVLLGLPAFRRIAAIAKQFGGLASLIEGVTGESVVDAKGAEALAGIQGVAQQTASRGVPLVMEMAGAKRFKLLTYLDPEYLRVPEEELDGEATVVCKITRLLRRGDSIDLSPVADLMTATQQVNRQARRAQPKAQKVEVPFSDKIVPPAAVVTAVAIFR